MPDYTAVPELELYVFEESYVLGIDQSADAVTFSLELVLTDRHPQYRPPPADEQFCFRTGRLAFVGASDVDLERSTVPPSRDPDGSVDYGSIDAFTVDGSRSALEGDWGSLTLSSAAVRVDLDAA